ncbi:hypothetical protein FIM02_00625 [SAR202 cluster bacterium AD-802-E10_MRT_200m]|nr:hypothetical protein [SAR202 cluster bacterium AD-802-E10_MRT_200m]
MGEIGSKLEVFIEETKDLLDGALDQTIIVHRLKYRLNEIISDKECLKGFGNGSSPDKSFPIYVNKGLTVSVVVWESGSGAPPHNHNTWALIGVVEGNEQNTNYKRVDDGSIPWFAQLETLEVVNILPGQSSFIFPPDDIHSVVIPGPKTVALHVYGADLSKQWRYQYDLSSGSVSPFLGRSLGSISG